MPAFPRQAGTSERGAGKSGGGAGTSEHGAGRFGVVAGRSEHESGRSGRVAGASGPEAGRFAHQAGTSGLAAGTSEHGAGASECGAGRSEGGVETVPPPRRPGLKPGARNGCPCGTEGRVGCFDASSVPSDGHSSPRVSTWGGASRSRQRDRGGAYSTSFRSRSSAPACAAHRLWISSGVIRAASSSCSTAGST
jgi:hypothetical protein